MPELKTATATAERTQVFRKLICLIQAIPGADPSIEFSEQTLVADLSMDSLRLVEIIFELERYFDAAADEGLLAEAHTLGDVVSLFCDTAKECEAGV